MTPRGPLIPNLGAEEGGDWRALLKRDSPVRGAARLWRLLFEADRPWLGGGDAIDWPPALGEASDAPVFDWIGTGDAAVAWWNDEEAERVAREAGSPLAGGSPECVRRVHDKAFAHRVAERERRLPRSLRGCIEVLEPELLREPDAACRAIDAALEHWPEVWRERFTLKPRLGSSGRGRVAGSARAQGDAALRGALPRLAERGGALLEPWLARREDLSAQLHVGDGGELLLLGSAELLVDASGLYRGHRGCVDYRGRVTSDSSYEETLREAAVEVAQAAAEEGYRGPCGVDAFAFETPDGDVELRSVVEFNARFTLGIVVTGLIRRALPRFAETVGLSPGSRRPFWFGLEPPAGGWPLRQDAEVCCVSFAAGTEPTGPALVVADTHARLAEVLGE